MSNKPKIQLLNEPMQSQVIRPNDSSQQTVENQKRAQSQTFNQGIKNIKITTSQNVPTNQQPFQVKFDQSNDLNQASYDLGETQKSKQVQQETKQQKDLNQDWLQKIQQIQTSEQKVQGKPNPKDLPQVSEKFITIEQQQADIKMAVESLEELIRYCKILIQTADEAIKIRYNDPQIQFIQKQFVIYRGRLDLVVAQSQSFIVKFKESDSKSLGQKLPDQSRTRFIQILYSDISNAFRINFKIYNTLRQQIVKDLDRMNRIANQEHKKLPEEILNIVIDDLKAIING